MHSYQIVIVNINRNEDEIVKGNDFHFIPWKTIIWYLVKTTRNLGFIIEKFVFTLPKDKNTHKTFKITIVNLLLHLPKGVIFLLWSTFLIF